MTFSKIKILISKARMLGLIKLTSYYDFALFKLGILQKVHIKEGESVIYLGANLAARIPRMVKWLKRAENYDAVLICQKDGFNKGFSNDFFDQTILFRNKWHLYRILKTLKRPKLIHAFGPKSYYPDLAREFMKGTKFIYDMQDVLVIYFGTDPGIRYFYEEFKHEKNCLEYADGLVSHGLEPIAGYKLYNIRKNNTLYFPLYCDDDVLQDNTKVLCKDDIHLVYAGEIQSAHRNKSMFGNVQLHELIDILSKQKIHLHAYPSPATLPVYFDEYASIAEKNPYFHLHKAVPQSELTKELSKYHFGIIPFFKEDTNLSQDKNRYSTSLKLYNFIEAGIPIIISKDITFQCWIAERYDAAVPITKPDVNNLREIIEKIDYPQMTRQLIKSREQLSLKKNISKLKCFYSKVA